MKQREIKQKREKIIDGDIDLFRFIAIATSDEIYMTGFNLQES